jgi:branched-chain amino acid transport system ATP-binding protein
MSALLGASAASFLGMSLLFGAAALATGGALARNWRPAWQSLAYALLLGVGHRFLLYALFSGELLSPSGYAAAAVLLALLALLGYRLTQVRLMLRQYPWLYEPAGPFAWREKR